MLNFSLMIKEISANQPMDLSATISIVFTGISTINVTKVSDFSVFTFIFLAGKGAADY